MTGRRTLLLALLLAAPFGVARAAEAARKATKAEAQYQDRPKDIRSCATCTLFVAPDACKSVEGKVSPDGWCNLYDLAD